jgi:hypothetical protein
VVIQWSLYGAQCNALAPQSTQLHKCFFVAKRIALLVAPINVQYYYGSEISTVNCVLIEADIDISAIAKVHLM